jgi:hypothetical protein
MLAFHKLLHNSLLAQLCPIKVVKFKIKRVRKAFCLLVRTFIAWEAQQMEILLEVGGAQDPNSKFISWRVWRGSLNPKLRKRKERVKNQNLRRKTGNSSHPYFWNVKKTYSARSNPICITDMKKIK